MSQYLKLTSHVLAFLVVSSPETYKMTSQALGDWVANASGKPQMAGLLLHAVVFLVILRILNMVLPRQFKSE